MPLSVSYALRYLYGSEFHVVLETVGGLVAARRRNLLQRREEPVRVEPSQDGGDAAIHPPLN